MQVLCYSNEHSVEIRCHDCGQGFALYWGRQTETEKAVALEGMVNALKAHCCIASGVEPHSTQGSLVTA
jgi:hypothetical protein